MRVPMTNQTRTHAEVQLTRDQWMAILAMLPAIPRFIPPPGQRTLREIIEIGLIGSSGTYPVRIRLTRDDAAEVVRIATTIPG